MDYIIIALWGLLAGGLLWNNTESQPAADPYAEVRVVDPYGMGVPTASSTKKIARHVDESAAGQQSKQSQREANQSQKEAKRAARQARKEARRKEKAQRPAPSGGLFNRTKQEQKKPAHRALTFRGQQPEEQEAPDTLVVYALKSDQGVVYTTDAEVANAAIEASRAIEQEQTQAKPQTTAPKSETRTPAASTTTASGKAPAATSAKKRTDVKLPGRMKIEQVLCTETGDPKRHSLRRGESLTQIAQRYYGDSSFWPYVYEVNRHQLSSPDKLQAGMKLYLPDPKYYDIDAKSQKSLSKARTLINKYSK